MPVVTVRKVGYITKLSTLDRAARALCPLCVHKRWWSDGRVARSPLAPPPRSLHPFAYHQSALIARDGFEPEPPADGRPDEFFRKFLTRWVQGVATIVVRT